MAVLRFSTTCFVVICMLVAIVYANTVTHPSALSKSKPELNEAVDSTRKYHTADSESKREKRQASCGPELLMRLKGCCACSNMLPKSVMASCSGMTNNSSTREAFEQAARTIKNAIQFRKLPETSELKDIGQNFMNAMKNSPGGPVCMFECVFKNQSFLTSSGAINYPTVSSAILANVNSTWQPVVKAALANCTTLTKNITLPTLPSGVKLCNPLPATFMMCMHASTLLNCPSQLINTNSTCAANFAALASCKPPTSIPAMRSGGMPPISGAYFG